MASTKTIFLFSVLLRFLLMCIRLVPAFVTAYQIKIIEK